MIVYSMRVCELCSPACILVTRATHMTSASGIEACRLRGNFHCSGGLCGTTACYLRSVSRAATPAARIRKHPTLVTESYDCRSSKRAMTDVQRVPPQRVSIAGMPVRTQRAGTAQRCRQRQLCRVTKPHACETRGPRKTGTTSAGFGGGCTL